MKQFGNDVTIEQREAAAYTITAKRTLREFWSKHAAFMFTAGQNCPVIAVAQTLSKGGLGRMGYTISIGNAYATA